MKGGFSSLERVEHCFVVCWGSAGALCMNGCVCHHCLWESLGCVCRWPPVCTFLATLDFMLVDPQRFTKSFFSTKHCPTLVSSTKHDTSPPRVLVVCWSHFWHPCLTLWKLPLFYFLSLSVFGYPVLAAVCGTPAAYARILLFSIYVCLLSGRVLRLLSLLKSTKNVCLFTKNEWAVVCELSINYFLWKTVACTVQMQPNK